MQIPRFAFEKFPGSKPELSTMMKSVGEAMAIGRTFQVPPPPAPSLGPPGVRTTCGYIEGNHTRCDEGHACVIGLPQKPIQQA